MKSSARILLFTLALFISTARWLTSHATAQTFTTLHDFTAVSGVGTYNTNLDGAEPYAALVLSDDTLYGTAHRGGTRGIGALFALNIDGSGFTPLTGNLGVAADWPQCEVRLAGKYLYGTTVYSGKQNAGFGGFADVGNGGIFAYSLTDNYVTNLHSFAAGTDGFCPVGTLTASGETLYGTTSGDYNPLFNGGDRVGVTLGNGSIFKVNRDGSGFTTLHGFEVLDYLSNINADGIGPFGGLVLSGNTLYGTTSFGGNSGDGVVFKINTDGSGFALLHQFSGSDGWFPNGGLILAGNTLYGTTRYGGSSMSDSFYGSGTIFQVNMDGTGFAVVHNFSTLDGTGNTNTDGAEPFCGVALYGNTLYGTTLLGGYYKNGAVFAVNTDGSGFTNLHNFSAFDLTGIINPDGAQPYGGVILNGSTLFGTASFGGASGQGTVFKISLDNTETFTTTPTIGANPLSVQFSTPGMMDGNGHAITNLSWDFGDGSTGAGVNPAHTYTNAGIYLAKFSATNTTGGVVSGTGHAITAIGGTNFVVNGDFETGDFTGWTPVGDFTFNAVATDPNYVHSGTYGAQMGADGALCYLAQTLPTTAGGKYLVSFWLNGDGFTPNEFQAVWNGVTIVDLPDVPGIGWTNIQFIATADSPATVIQFGFRDDVTWLGFDDVSVLAAPFNSPQLSIAATDDGIILTWPTNAIGFTAQSTTNLSPPIIWNAISSAPAIVNGQNTLTNASAGVQVFYRLMQP